jgi:Protein of unknown function (DUF4012)
VVAVVLGAALLAAGTMVAVQALAQARRAQGELVAARELLGRAGALGGGSLAERGALLDRAAGRIAAARGRLRAWQLGTLAAVPLAGRDVRVARAVADAAADAVAATREVAATVTRLQGRPPTGATLAGAAGALLSLHATLDRGAAGVRATRPLLATATARRAFLAAAGAASRTAAHAGDGLRLAARLWGPRGSARWFLALQNPAELRGTGGLIGQYGILEASPHGPTLATVAPYETLGDGQRNPVPLAADTASPFQQFPIDSAFWAVNMPPDLPTVGRLIVTLYQHVARVRVDGVIMADPLALAEILRRSGPIAAGGLRLDARNVARATMVDAYVRYAADNDARHRFLAEVAGRTFAVLRAEMATRPAELVHALGTAASGRHLQVFADDRAGEAALLGLGLGGSAAAPPQGDYLLPAGNNTGGNKVDAFLHRSIGYRVRLQPDGGARATVTIALRNASPAGGLPSYVIGPYDRRFRPGENDSYQTVYLAGGYGFTRATRDGRQVKAAAQDDLGALTLSQAVSIPPGRTATLGYELVRPAAVEILGHRRIRYQLLLRPQATVWPDQAEVSVAAPPGWRFAGAVGGGVRLARTTASWAGPLDRERTLVFDLTPTG